MCWHHEEVSCWVLPSLHTHWPPHIYQLGHQFAASSQSLQVRIAALGSLLRLLEVLPPEQRRQQALPIARAHMQPLELALPVQRVLAAGFGRLLAAVSFHMGASVSGGASSALAVWSAADQLPCLP